MPPLLPLQGEDPVTVAWSVGRGRPFFFVPEPPWWTSCFLPGGLTHLGEDYPQAHIPSTIQRRFSVNKQRQPLSTIVDK
jgi:hypothetical protein